MELLSMGSPALIFHIFFFFSFSSPPQFFVQPLFDVTTTKEQRMCLKSGDLVELMMMAVQSFVMPKKSLLDAGQKQAFGPW